MIKSHYNKIKPSYPLLTTKYQALEASNIK